MICQQKVKLKNLDEYIAYGSKEKGVEVALKFWFADGDAPS